eukprot:363948-Chlamydomonas_euryale.AAC.4
MLIKRVVDAANEQQRNGLCSAFFEHCSGHSNTSGYKTPSEAVANAMAAAQVAEPQAERETTDDLQLTAALRVHAKPAVAEDVLNEVAKVFTRLACSPKLPQKRVAQKCAEC